MFENANQKSDQQTITVNDKEYPVDSLSGAAKYYIKQLADVENKLAAKNFEVDQLRGAKLFFTNSLVDAVENPPAEEEASADTAEETTEE